MVHDQPKSHWSKIRDAVFGELTKPQPLGQDEVFTVDAKGYGSVKRCESFILNHGIAAIETHVIEYAQGYVSIKDVVHNEKSNTFVLVFTDGNLCSLNVETSHQEIFKCKQPVYSLTIAEKYKRYITLCRDKVLRILSEEFELVSTIPYSGNINGLVYNKFTNEIITHGVGCITVWMFRTAGTILVPRKVIRESLPTNETISHFEIEKTYSESQRCFAVVEKNVFVFRLQDGECLQQITDAHNVEITDILYYKPLQMLVTSARDGSIKVWHLVNQAWELNCLFIGHTGKVTSVAEYPYSPYIVSSSTDGTVRTWSLDTKDEMNCQTLPHPVLGLSFQPGLNRLFSFSKFMIHGWKINNVYSPFTVLGSKAKLLRSTKYPFLQTMTACICGDGCARIVCPATGEIVTVFISPNFTYIKDIFCIASEGILFALLIDGRIIKASMKTNPCSIIQTWNKTSTKVSGTVTCFLLFEYHAPKGDGSVDEVKSNEKEKKLVLGGCMDGTIVVFDWSNDEKKGRITFSLQAHREEISCMAVNTGLNQLATSSQDLTLKIWRVFPFASEALAPLLMLMNHAPVTHLQFVHHSLGVVYQDTSKSSFSFAMFKTKNTYTAKPIDHALSEDHSDVITCLDACPKLRIFATASMDCTLRIWSNENRLIRLLKLDDVAHSLTFCSQRGDIVLGIGSNLNYIHHRLYLPVSYLYQMVAMLFIESQKVEPITINQNLKLTVHDKNRLYRAHSSYMKFMKFIDEVPETEKQQRQEEEAEKEKEFKLLKARDEELELLKEGKMKATRKKVSSKVMKATREEAFQKYLELFYDRTKIQYPKDDDFDMDEETFIVKMGSTYNPPQINDTFFAIKANSSDIKNIKKNLRNKREAAAKRKEEAERRQTRESRSLSIGVADFEEFREKMSSRPTLSASTTYVERLQAMRKSKSKSFNFCGEKLETLEASASAGYPDNKVTTRSVNKQIIRRLQQHEHSNEPRTDGLPVAPDGFIPNSVVVALYRELRRESEQTSEKDWIPRQLTEEQLAEIDQLTKNKSKVEVEEVIADSPVSPEPSIEYSLSDDEPEEPVSKILEQFQNAPVQDEIDLSTPPPTPPVPPKEKTPPPPPPVVEKTIKRKPIKRYISRPKVAEPKVTPTVVNIPPPRPPTPLPKFISQFADFDWFKELFPILNSRTFGQPLVGDFIRSLLEQLVIVKDYDTKIKITSAILLVYQQEGFDENLKQLVRRSLLSELNQPGGKPSSVNAPVELEFIKKALQMILEMNMLSTMVIVELMVQYVLGYPSFRKEILQTFTDLGLQDTKGYFSRELCTTFDVANIAETEKKWKSREMCSAWIDEWTKKFKQHITSLSGQICRKKNKSKSILKKAKKDVNGLKKKEITFVSKNFVSGAAEGISTIDVINYFCEMKYEETIARLKAEAAMQKSKIQTKQTNRNTVLMLPKKEGYASLARIGETHQSKCHPERETSLFYGPPLPAIDSCGIASLLLHSKKINLAPFPEEMDDLMYVPHTCVQSSLITLKYSPKYFIPARSFVM